MNIERLAAKDFEEAIDFINMVFSVAHCPMDFLKILPRLYKPTDECMNCNLVVKESGRIRALVGLYPDIMQAGDVSLKLGGIGAVSSHPNDRGKGWMKLLMDRRIMEMRQDGYDLSFLAGQRQRYMFFGYEKSGVMLEYKINKSNLNHYRDAASLPVINFEPVQASDLPYIAKAKELHDTQPIHCLRPINEFYLFTITWQMQPWICLYPDGGMAGYLVANKERNSICEIFAENDDAFMSMVISWCLKQDVQEISITMPSWALSSARRLGNIAEDIRVMNNCNWQIFNWQKVVDSLLRVKNALHSLVEGTLRIGIREYGTIQISVSCGAVTCKKTSEQPDVEWDSMTATRILFGHVASSLVTVIPEKIEPLAAYWFPLPLSWLPMNHV